MHGWKSKVIILLVVYFAGFATGVYTLAPGQPGGAKECAKKGLPYSAIKSDEFAKSFSESMHRCVGVTKDYAWRAGRFIKDKLDERPLKTGG